MYTNNTSASTDLEDTLTAVKAIAERADKKADDALSKVVTASRLYSSSSYTTSKTEYNIDTLLDKVEELENKVRILEDRDEEIQLLYDQVDELAKKNIKLANKLKKMKKRMDSVTATAWKVDTAKYKKREHTEMKRKIAADAKKRKENAKVKEALGNTEFIIRDEYGRERLITLDSTDNAWVS